jgi:signal transduction histidine kinase
MNEHGVAPRSKKQEAGEENVRRIRRFSMVPYSEAQRIRQGGPARALAPQDRPGILPEPITHEMVDHYVARRPRLRAEAVAHWARRAGAALARPFRRQRAGAGAAEEAVVTVAHQLRTPLTAIRSFSEILRDNPDIPREQRILFLNTILEESDRLNRSITEVVDGLNAGQPRGDGECGAAQRLAG